MQTNQTLQNLKNLYWTFKQKNIRKTAKLPPEVKTLAMQLKSEGYSRVKIASEIGVTSETVKHWLLPVEKIKHKADRMRIARQNEAEQRRIARATTANKSTIKVIVNGFEITGTKDDLRDLLGINK